MGNESHYKPIDLDSVFGPETDIDEAPAHLSMYELQQQKELSEGKIWRALFHKSRGMTDDLYDPQTGAVVDVIYEDDTKYYSIDGHTFRASLFEGNIVLDNQFNGQIKHY